MSHRFLVTGAASPDLPLRVLNLFAQQDLAFDHVQVSRAEDAYRIAVEIADLPPARAEVMLHKMRAMVLVEAAELNS